MDFPSTGNCQPPMSEEELRQRVRDLCRLDNLTNVAYLAQTYLYLAAVIGIAVWFCERQPASGWQFWLILPGLPLAILLIGAGQHRLSALGHEGAHHLCFIANSVNFPVRCEPRTRVADVISHSSSDVG